MTRRRRPWLVRTIDHACPWIFGGSFVVAFQAHRPYLPAVLAMVASGLLVTFFVATKGNQS